MKPFAPDAPPVHPLQAALGLAFYILLAVGFGAMTSVALVATVKSAGGPVAAVVLSKGPEGVMARSMQFWGLVYLPVLLRLIGWRGWRDTGYAPDPPAAPEMSWGGRILQGAALGLVTLGAAALLMLALGRRTWEPEHPLSALPFRMLGFAASGIVVSLLEETVARGILFRVLARSWGVLASAAITSLLFALSHFLRPDPAAFERGSWLASSASVFATSFVNIPNVTHFPLRLLNLTLLGAVLCGFVARTRTVWFSVGAHAAWVWCMKTFNMLTTMPEAPEQLEWLGHRSDTTDSPISTVMLAGLLAGVVFWRRRRQATLPGR